MRYIPPSKNTYKIPPSKNISWMMPVFLEGILRSGFTSCFWLIITQSPLLTVTLAHEPSSSS